jgi:hypothetical protein
MFIVKIRGVLIMFTEGVGRVRIMQHHVLHHRIHLIQNRPLAALFDYKPGELLTLPRLLCAKVTDLILNPTPLVLWHGVGS